VKNTRNPFIVALNRINRHPTLTVKRGHTRTVSWIVVLLFFTGTMWMSCGGPQVRPNPLKRVILNSRQIHAHHLDEKQIRSLEVYLEKELVVQLQAIHRSGDVTSRHDLELQKKELKESLTFKAGARGVPVRTENVRKLYFFDQGLHIDVSFDTGTPGTLRFRPDDNGNYVLRVDNGHINYNGRRYLCRMGCETNHLLVDVRTLEDAIETSRVIHGRPPLTDPDSK
jgi:hypothetical protein